MITTTLSCLLLLNPQQDPQVDPAHPVVARAQMLPDDALAVLSVPALSHQANELAQTGAQQLFGPLESLLEHDELLAHLESFGLSPVDLQAVLHDGFSVAVTGFESPDSVQWLLVSGTGGRGNAIRRAMSTAVESLESRGNTFSTTSIQDAEVWTVTSPDNSSAAYSVTDDLVVIADSLQTIEEALNRAARGKKSLADAPGFQRFATQCAAAEATPLFTLFVQPQPLLSNLLSQVPPMYAGLVEEGLGRLELSRLSEFGFSLYAKDGELHDLGWLGYPAPRAGLLASFLGDSSVHPDQLRIVTPDAISASLFSVDLAAIYSEALELGRLFNPAVPQMVQATLSELRSSADVDVEQDILNVLGTRAVFQEWSSLDSANRSFAFTLEVLDPAVVNSALEDLAEGLSLHTSKVGQKTALVFDGIPTPGASMHVFVHGDQLLAVNSAVSAQRMVDALDLGTGNKKVQAALSELAHTPHSFSWSDCARLGSQWLRSLSIEVGDRAIAEELAEVVTKTGGTQVSEVHVSDEGILSQSRSPFGNLYLTLTAAYFFRSTFGDVFVDSLATPQQAPEIAHLQDILAAERDFRAVGHNDADEDGSGEFGTLDALVESSLLSERQFTSPAPGSFHRIGDYFYQVALPGDVDSRETGVLAFAWPADQQTGTVYAGTPDGQVYSNPIIALTEGLRECDPRDFYAGGEFGSAVLPGWERIDITEQPVVDTQPDENPEMTPAEEEQYRLILSAERRAEFQPELVELLESHHPVVAARAAFTLGKLKSKEGVPELCAMVKEYDDADVKRHAMSALTKIRDRRSINTSIEALAAGDPVVRQLAAQNLGFLQAEKAKDGLLDMLSVATAQDAPDRIAGLIALADIGDPDCLVQAAASVMRPGIEEEKAMVYLFQTLSSKLDAKSEAQTLAAVLANDSKQLRRYAIQRLGIIKQPGSERALMGRLAHETDLAKTIEVSLDAIRQDNEPNRKEGLIPLAKEKSLEYWGKAKIYWGKTQNWWKSLDETEQYYVAGGGATFLILLVVMRALRRRRRQRREQDAMVAMVAPSDEYSEGQDFEGGYDEGYDAEYDDEYSEEHADEEPAEGEYVEEANSLQFGDDNLEGQKQEEEFEGASIFDDFKD